MNKYILNSQQRRATGDFVGQRPPLHFFHLEILPERAGYGDPVQHSLSSTERWPIREEDSDPGGLIPIVYDGLRRIMGGALAACGVCIQQQFPGKHWDGSI